MYKRQAISRSRGCVTASFELLSVTSVWCFRLSLAQRSRYISQEKLSGRNPGQIHIEIQGFWNVWTVGIHTKIQGKARKTKEKQGKVWKSKEKARNTTGKVILIWNVGHLLSSKSTNFSNTLKCYGLAHIPTDACFRTSTRPVWKRWVKSLGTASIGRSLHGS